MTPRSDLLAMMDEILRRQATGQVFPQVGSAMLSLVAFGRLLVGYVDPATADLAPDQHDAPDTRLRVGPES